MKIQCRTLFDITATGVTGHYKPSRVPFVNRAGISVTNEVDWNHARNQQRNWETLSQLISLRTQVNNLTDPVRKNGAWYFEFEIDNNNLFENNTGPLGLLYNDCADVPMLLGLTENVKYNQLIPEINLWFTVLNI